MTPLFNSIAASVGGEEYCIITYCIPFNILLDQWDLPRTLSPLWLLGGGRW